MVHHAWRSLTLLFGCGVLMTGCFSRQLAVMDLNDTLNAIADELCDVSLKGTSDNEIELVTATGFTAGVDGAGLGVPISVSGNVSDSTKIKVQIAPKCADEKGARVDKAMRLAKRPNRAVYRYDTGTGTLTPLNDEARDRLKKKP